MFRVHFADAIRSTYYVMDRQCFVGKLLWVAPRTSAHFQRCYLSALHLFHQRTISQITTGVSINFYDCIHFVGVFEVESIIETQSSTEYLISYALLTFNKK